MLTAQECMSSFMPVMAADEPITHELKHNDFWENNVLLIDRLFSCVAMCFNEFCSISHEGKGENEETCNSSNFKQSMYQVLTGWR